MLKYKYKVLSLRRIIYGMQKPYLIYIRIILINILFYEYNISDARLSF